MNKKFNIANFWSRIWALFIDSIVLGIIGLVLGLMMEDSFVSMGTNGILVGFTLSLLYFTFANSKIGDGSTLGKKVMKIQVVDKNENWISIQTSFLRSLILISPYFLVNYAFTQFQIVESIKIVILLSMLIGIIVLYIFNKATRQSLHDLVLHTFVVKENELENSIEFQTNKKTGVYVTGVLIILLVSFTLYNATTSNPTQEQFISATTTINDIEGVIKSGASRNTTTFYGKQESTTVSYNLVIWVSKLPKSETLQNSRIVKQAIKVLINSELEIGEFDVISVKLVKGFNIGIARKNRSSYVSKTPEEWRSIIE
ncbi:RDD family protein [Reichenbachiella sp.]